MGTEQSMIQSALRFIAAAISAFAFLQGNPASAQAWPSKPIRLVVPFAPGGPTDAVARIVGNKMSLTLGQQIIIDNKPGASTIIGSDAVAKAAPDGYTIGLITDSHTINRYLGTLPYDSVNSFQPISTLVSVTFALVAGAQSEVTSFHSLISSAKAKPGKITYASLGVGTPHHLLMELLNKKTGTDMTHVPFKGAPEALTQIAAGRVDVMFQSVGAVIPLIKSGKLVPIGVTSTQRYPAFPDVPTVAESTGEPFFFTSFYGIVVPAGTNTNVVKMLNGAINAALANPEVRAQLTALNMEPIPSSAEQFVSLLAGETQKYGNLIKLIGLKAER